jgi:hypothetical protein
MGIKGGDTMTIYDSITFDLCVNVLLFYLSYLIIQQFVYGYKINKEMGEEE